MNILFVLPVLSDSYYRKRIDKMSVLGVVCTVLGFERDHYPGKPWSVKTESLGHFEHGEYTRRIGKLFTSVFKIRKHAKKQDAIYAFNLDILFICWLATLFQPKKIKLVYDVADIRSILVKNGFLPAILRKVERFLVRQASVVVVASPAYIDGYFKNFPDQESKFFVIENKVDKDLLPHSIGMKEIHSKKEFLTIGYFGMLRCRQSLHFLRHLIESSRGAIRLVLRGIFLQTEDFEPLFKDLDSAHYGGAFIYPDELEEMYANIDLVWAAHLHGVTNSKWSISNRFYQACYFKKPLIAQSNTMDAKRVIKYNIGCVIDVTDHSSAMKTLQAIGNDRISLWKKNMTVVPEEVYTFTDEHEQLLGKLKTTK